MYALSPYPGRTRPHAVTAVGYLIEDVTFDHWKFVHDPGANAYIWEGEINGTVRIIKVIPPGQSKPAFTGTGELHSIISARVYPNPFGSEATIYYRLRKDSHVRVTIVNLLGQTVRSLDLGWKRRGWYRLCWDGRDFLGRDVSKGLYLYRIVTNFDSVTGKMLLLR